MHIIRSIAAVIVGYIAMAVFVFGSFTVAYIILGVEGAHKPASWEVSSTWLYMSFAVGFVAAMLGGIAAALIAVRGSCAPFVLAVIVLILGLMMGLFEATATPPADKPATRPAQVSQTDAIKYSEQPAIALWLNPIIGMTGVLIGARVIKRSARSQPS